MRRTILWIAFALIALGGLGVAVYVDQPIASGLRESQGKRWKKTADYKFHTAVRKIADWPGLMLAGGIGLLIARGMRNREWQRILIAGMLASTLAGVVANASRLTTGRVRPKEVPKIEAGFYGPWNHGKLLIGDPPYNSFPSGHTATAFGLAFVIAFARPWLGVGALFLAVLVGWSSMVTGNHWTSDVWVSVALSFVVAWNVWRWVQKNGDATARKVLDRIKRRRKGSKQSTTP